MSKKPKKTIPNKIAAAEKTAHDKLERMRQQGIRVGSLNPIKPVDTSNKRAARKYLKELERFNSTSSQYIAGYDGTPIPKKAFDEYKRIEQRWNTVHAMFWKSYGSKKVILPEGESDTSLAMKYLMSGVKNKSFIYNRDLQPENIRSLKDLQKRKEILVQEIAPGYRKTRVQKLRENMLDFVQYLNVDGLAEAISELTDEELLILQERTDFVEMFYYRYKGNTSDSIIDALEESQENEHLFLLIKGAKKAAAQSVSRAIKTTNKRRFRRNKKHRNKRRH